MVPILTAVLPLVDTLIDRLIPDEHERAKVKMEIEAQAASAQVELQKAQIDLAKEDAKTGFGGYRWGAGWLCVISLGYAWLLHPLLVWVATAQGWTPPPALDPGLQYSMLMGMLGLAGVRSHDLLKGTRN
jgi:hypothetical protein